MTLVTRQSMSDDDGTFISGTVVNKAFVDQVYDQIDDQAHSTTNPTIKPKAITDEVVTARGSKASLDARLDIALNEDGTLKTQASLVTQAQAGTQILARNVALNGDLLLWPSGPAATPVGFTLSGAGATIARTGPGEADTNTFGTGRYAAKVTRVGNDTALTQPVIAAADFADFSNVKGQKFSVAMKAATTLSSFLRLVVDDGATQTASTYHTGGGVGIGDELFLTVTHTISNSATKLEFKAEFNGSNGDGYVGGFVAVFSDIAPSDWSPFTFNAYRRLLDSPRVSTNTTQVGNVGGGEDDLMSYSVSPQLLFADGMALRITAWGTLGANANSKTLKFHFGATSITLLSAVTTNGGAWRADITVIRTGATAQLLNGKVTRDAIASDVKSAAPAETLANQITAKFTGQSGASASDDVVQAAMIVELI